METMTDKQMEVMLNLMADKFADCMSMDEVKEAIDEVRKMVKKEKNAEEMEEASVFKCFLREQLENQKELGKAINDKNFEKAKELVEKMIDRTQKGIEDD